MYQPQHWAFYQLKEDNFQFNRTNNIAERHQKTLKTQLKKGQSVDKISYELHEMANFVEKEVPRYQKGMTKPRQARFNEVKKVHQYVKGHQKSAGQNRGLRKSLTKGLQKYFFKYE